MAVTKDCYSYHSIIDFEFTTQPLYCWFLLSDDISKPDCALVVLEHTLTAGSGNLRIGRYSFRYYAVAKERMRFESGLAVSIYGDEFHKYSHFVRAMERAKASDCLHEVINKLWEEAGVSTI